MIAGMNDQRPNRIPWPPIIYAGVLIAALALNRLAPPAQAS
jgi:hypothetical protein